jgi:1-deoxy-D-xylulose-5-phosphate synthase
MNEEELRNLMYTAQHGKYGPIQHTIPPWQWGDGRLAQTLQSYPGWQRPQRFADGEDVAIVSIGAIGNEVVKAAAQLNELGYYPAHYDLRFVKPLDAAMLHEVFSKFRCVITVEDGCIEGGMGTALLEFMADNNYQATNVIRLGIPDRYIEHGEQPELWAECGYDAAAIVAKVQSLDIKCNKHTIAS